MIGLFHKILVPVDFSPCSDAAFKRAMRLARASKLEPVMLHVIDIGAIAACNRLAGSPVRCDRTAELFTGNNLIGLARASGRVTTQQVMRNWGRMYLGNLVGAIGTTVLVWLAGMHSVSNGAVGEAMVQVARSKIALDPVSALAGGV